MLTKIPMQADNRFITTKLKSVFRKLRFARFLFSSMEIFITAEVTDIRKYPMMSEYVPKYFGKKMIQKISKLEEIT